MREATALANALLRHGKVEQPAYLLMGDELSRIVRHDGETKTLEFRDLPLELSTGGVHTVTLRLHDPQLVNAAREGGLGLGLSTGGESVPFGFHRVEHENSQSVLSVFIFSFPGPLAQISLRAVNLPLLIGRVREAIEALGFWIDLNRELGLEELDSELHKIGEEVPKLLRGEYVATIARGWNVSSSSGTARQVERRSRH